LNYSLSLSGIIIPSWVLLTASFVISFVIAYISIPTVVLISKFKKLFDIPNERASHTGDVPVLGGLSVFAGFSLAAIICTIPDESGTMKYLLGGIIVLFFLGLKDDVLVVDPKKKFVGQIIAAIIVVIFGDVRITNFHLVFGIDNISNLSSILFSLFLFLLLINGFNLIDGVDGLASGIGTLICLATGVWFIMAGHYYYSIIGFALAGALLAYMRFNIFDGKNKIFMGDTGSMITGLIVTVLVVKFLEYVRYAPQTLQFESAPALAFSLVIVPMFDTLRIIVVRISRGSSPFKSDKNHIHHSLLNLGYSHVKATITIITINIMLVLFVVVFQKLGNIPLIIIMLILALILSLLPKIILAGRKKFTTV
jgi:UDP-GlcNAc:undecaprenyl-phosphate GlcNAc-1-phosphate transferase